MVLHFNERAAEHPYGSNRSKKANFDSFFLSGEVRLDVKQRLRSIKRLIKTVCRSAGPYNATLKAEK